MARPGALTAFFRRNKWALPAAAIIVIAAIAGAVFLVTQPSYGTFRYGLCRTFLEYEFAYPPTIEILTVTEESKAARIYFAEKNPFGNERIIQADCDFQIDSARNQVTLLRLSFDRKPIPKERVARYNRMIPTLMAMELNKELPPVLPRSLDRLKR